MVFCDEAPPHTGSLRQKVLWEREREKKSVCLFSSSIVMLIIRNWRRCILVRVEFQVFFPPLSPFIISSLKMLKRRYVSWRCEVNTLYNYWILMTTFSFLFVNCLWEEKHKLSHTLLHPKICDFSIVCPNSQHPTCGLCSIDGLARSASSLVFNGAHRSLPILSPFPLKLDTRAHVSSSSTFLRKRLEHGAKALTL